MGTDALTAPPRGWLARTWEFLRDVRGEIRKVTWTTWDELKKATWVIIVFVLALGLLIGLMDSILQAALVTSIAKLF